MHYSGHNNFIHVTLSPQHHNFGPKGHLPSPSLPHGGKEEHMSEHLAHQVYLVLPKRVLSSIVSSVQNHALHDLGQEETESCKYNYWRIRRYSDPTCITDSIKNLSVSCWELLTCGSPHLAHRNP